MNNTNSNSRTTQPLSTQIKSFSLVQWLATSLAAFLIFNTALGFLLYSLLEILSPNTDAENAFSLLLLSSGFFTVGLLLIPPSFLALYRFLEWNTPSWISSLPFPPLSVSILSYPLILLGGYWVSTQTTTAYLFLPFFHIAAIGTPIAIFLQISLKDLRGISPLRKWGALSVGLTLTPFLIFILETIAIIFPLVLLALWASLDPERVMRLNELAETLRQPLINPQAVLDKIQPYLIEPSVVLILLFFAGFVVPLIEEAIKPFGVWLLYGRTRGALDGFVAGALCGAGYALLESFLLSSSKSAWLFAVLGRSGTGAIHIFTSALVGATLTEVWHNHRYPRLILAYLIGVFFHGVWNSFAILSALRSVSETTSGFWNVPFTHNLAIVAPLAILLLVFLAVLGLWSFNRQIRKRL